MDRETGASSSSFFGRGCGVPGLCTGTSDGGVRISGLANPGRVLMLPQQHTASLFLPAKMLHKAALLFARSLAPTSGIGAVFF